jgi:transmembrane sensor
MRHIDSRLLDRVLAGEASGEERETLDARGRTYSSAAGAIDALRRAGVVSDVPLERWRTEGDVDSALAKVKQARPHLVDDRTTSHRTWRTIAAGAAVATAAAVLVFAVIRSRVDVERGLNENVVMAGATTRGQRLRVNLVDGTQVVLAPESRLSVAEGFERGARTAIIQGEAYFRVAHDASRPFRLRAGSGVVEVLGTEFTVRAYTEDSTVRVVVVSGRVSFRASQAGTRRSARPVLLERGDVAELDARDSVAVTHAGDPAPYVEWVSGRLDFDDAPLAEVARRLERWYDVRIVIGDSALATHRVSGVFRDQPLRDVLRSLCAGVRLRCVQTGRDVRIDGEGPAR